MSRELDKETRRLGKIRRDEDTRGVTIRDDKMKSQRIKELKSQRAEEMR